MGEKLNSGIMSWAFYFKCLGQNKDREGQVIG
jgi:hypothetical protein